MTTAPPPERRYGLDIETDTTIDGLDATRAAIVAVAVSTSIGDEVLLGEEAQILANLDRLLAELEPGVIITWNGTHFDLPFIAVRAAMAGRTIGLRLGRDAPSTWPPEYHPGPHTSSWFQHRHLDGYRLYRDDLGRTLGLSCGLKALSRLAGLDPVQVDRSRIHLLNDAEMRDYVASDARLARELVNRRMPVAWASADRMTVEAPLGGGARPGPSASPSPASGARVF